MNAEGKRKNRLNGAEGQWRNRVFMRLWVFVTSSFILQTSSFLPGGDRADGAESVAGGQRFFDEGKEAPGGVARNDVEGD